MDPSLDDRPLRTRLRRDQDGYLVWVRFTDTPLLVLALLFLGLLLLPYLTSLTGEAATAVAVANYGIWGAFAVDYVGRLYLALDRRQYVRRNLLDLLIVVVPFLRPIRAVRLLRLLRLVSIGGVVQKRAGSLHARVSTYIVSSTLVLIVVASFAIYDAERDAPQGNIKSLPDALWWAASTVTTVGYGDRYPVTGTGRAVAVGLMMVGIALLGIVTASFAAWFVSHINVVEETEQRTSATLDDVLGELRHIRIRLDVLEASGSAPK